MTGNEHKSNMRAKIGLEDDSVWFGFEQEYVLRTKDGNIAGFPKDGFPSPQGEYYCGVGTKNVSQREFVDMHLQLCLNAGLDITGVNAEVLLGQWEYQLFSKGAIKSSDDLWLSRYLLYKVAEYYELIIDLNPKPLRIGDWNGSGMHCNFSNERMRTEGGEEYFKSIFNAFESRHDVHIENYGSDNEYRLTGKHETQSMDKFSWGIADRGASIRVPLSTAASWNGYLEDRRPASNADPYRIVKVILDSLEFAEKLMIMKTHMNESGDVDSSKFGGLSNEELLEQYQKDAEIEFDNMVDLMESKANVPSEYIEFILNNGKQ
jgi:glutamine synthetase